MPLFAPEQSQAGSFHPLPRETALPDQRLQGTRGCGALPSFSFGLLTSIVLKEGWGSGSVTQGSESGTLLLWGKKL